MVWLPDVEKKFEDMFIHFDRMYERDRHTDGQTHRPHDGIGRACIVQVLRISVHFVKIFAKTIFGCRFSVAVTRWIERWERYNRRTDGRARCNA